jgi:hypothetical protein
MSLSPSRQAAIYAYRNLLKTQKSVFSGKKKKKKKKDIFYTYQNMY